MNLLEGFLLYDHLTKASYSNIQYLSIKPDLLTLPFEKDWKKYFQKHLGRQVLRYQHLK